MQPYFFPYIGYFSLINQVDHFILFDTPQFIRHGWIDRNKILKPNGESLYIKVPLVKHSRGTAIKDVTIKNEQLWKDKIFAQLKPYKKQTPNYNETIEVTRTALEIETDSLVELNYHSLKTMCKYLNIDTPISIWSKMDVKITKPNAPDEWARNICLALNAESYINPIGGIDFFDKNKYIKNNIDIKFLKSIPIPYKQYSNTFTPHLSILDVIMFNSYNSTKKLLDSFNYE